MTLHTEFTELDVSIMREVLGLAAKGSATTQPNPRVACILIKDGVKVGEGYHHQAGDLHAEREALKQAGENARGATAYINMEPCCHQGRTPPCTDALIDAGVVKVIAAMRDPNPQVAGGGFEMLKLAGIEVASGLLEKEARWLNRGFVTRMREQRPWVVLKSAATLDGRTAAANGESQWITGSEARAQVQRLRSESAAVLTGIGTVLADDPQLNVRLEGTERQPLRVVLDSQLRMPVEAKILKDSGVLIFTHSTDDEKIAILEERGADVIQLSSEGDSKIDLKAVLKELANWQCNEVLVEAGQTLSGAMLQQNLIDEMVLFYGGSVLGDKGMSMFAHEQAILFKERPEFTLINTALVGKDVRVTAVQESSLERLSS